MSTKTPRSRPLKRPRSGVTVIPFPTTPHAAVRQNRVRTARARIAAGYYDRDEVRDRLVDAVLEDLLER